jgi:hypothetical protein
MASGPLSIKNWKFKQASQYLTVCREWSIDDPSFLPRQTQSARGVPSQRTMALRLVEYPSIASSHATRTTYIPKISCDSVQSTPKSTSDARRKSHLSPLILRKKDNLPNKARGSASSCLPFPSTSTSFTKPSVKSANAPPCSSQPPP